MAARIAEQSCVNSLYRRGLRAHPWEEPVLRMMEEDKMAWILTDWPVSQIVQDPVAKVTVGYYMTIGWRERKNTKYLRCKI